MCGETVNMPVCLYTMCLCESLALRWRERSGCYERETERGEEWSGVFSFYTISFPCVSHFVPFLTPIVPCFSFHNSLY